MAFLRLFIPCFFLSLLLSCTVGFEKINKEDTPYSLTSETELLDSNYVLNIADFYSKGQFGSFYGQDSVAIHYAFFLQKQEDAPAIAISSGRTESMIKYKELIFDLYSNGYSIFIHDHRGQGFSGRMVEDHDMGYIDDFQYYVDDMKTFYETVITQKTKSNIFLIAHSLGGAIGMTYLEQHPKDFKAAVFSSPMLGLKPPTCGAVKLLIKDEPAYALGQHKYNDDKSSFDGNILTGSKVRYQRMVQAFEADTIARLGGASYQWVNRSCEQFDYLNNHLQEIQTPFILFSAQNEAIVSPRAHENFINEALKHKKSCKAYLIENAQHELLIEKDKQRIEVLDRSLQFFDSGVITE